MMKSPRLLLVVILAVVILVGFRFSGLNSNASPKETVSFQLNPPLKASTSQNAFTFTKAAVYLFQSSNNKSLESCFAMREWNTNKAYYSCGKKGEKIFVLEGKFLNVSAYPADVKAGNFRIVLGPGKYLNQNFTTRDIVRVDPGVEYTFRVVFENFDQVPDVFTLEYGDNEIYWFKLKVDLKNKRIIPAD